MSLYAGRGTSVVRNPTGYWYCTRDFPTISLLHPGVATCCRTCEHLLNFTTLAGRC